MIEPIDLAIIGGSGLYNIPGLVDIQETVLDTPFGKPSSPVITSRLLGKKIAFLARHGLGHQISPSEVNYRANIYALKSLGVQNIISISACGSLREDYAPGDIVIPDQLFDNTKNRQRTFFGDGLVAHIGVAEPFCNRLSNLLFQAANTSKEKKVHYGGTFITIEGPRFSTKAESNLYRSWGMSIIGMTTSPEAYLAREAEICYAVLAHVTDYDVWHTNESPVSVDEVIKVLMKNTNVAKEVIWNLIPAITHEADCSCRSALKNSLITNINFIPSKTREKLDLLIGKYIQ